MSKRVYKVNELIKEEISQILFKELGPEQGMFTVTAVETARDLRHATVWLGYIGNDLEGFFDNLTKKERLIQSVLNKRLVLKYVPKVTFRSDSSGEYAAELGEIFKKIKNKNG